MSAAEPLPRLLFFHKQGSSARTRFVRWPHGMLAFAPLPAGAVLEESAPAVRRHPADLIKDAACRLGLPDDALRAETDFDAAIDTPAGAIPVLLMQFATLDPPFATLDPPFAAVEALGGRFIAITEARDCAALELQLLRRAYEIIIG